MILTYNGVQNPSGLITFTGIPNILSVESSTVRGNKALLTISVNASVSTLDLSKTYTITVNGKTITSTTGTASNNLFWITNSSTATSRATMAASIVRALRNAGLVDYVVYSGSTISTTAESIVYVVAREVGSLYALTYSSTMGEAITFSYIVGSSTDEFIGARMIVDIFENDEYVTTLEKSYYKDKIDFNLSLILTTISEYDVPTRYGLNIYADYGTSISLIGSLDNMTSMIGYMTNQGSKYLVSGANLLALNVLRGTQEGVYNKTTLYVYEPTIPVSIYTGLSGNVTIEVNYLDSSKTLFRTESQIILNAGGFAQGNVVLDSTYFNQAYYVDLVIPDIGIVRYNVIKPTDATPRCQRVYYHNSYGGVSFFDFTGQITENHEVDNETYTKNIFDYYRDSSMELLKIYSKDTSITVTMKSHLMDRSAVWQFNDLLGSYDVWTNVNGVDYKIIVTSCRVDETETGVWEATVNYTYSLI